MKDKGKIQAVVIIVSLVWLVLAILAGSPDPRTVNGKKNYQTALKLYSIAVPAATIGLLAYDRYLWRLKPVRKFTKMPLLAGSWRGKLISNYIRPDGSAVDPIPAVLYITQTSSSITITLFTGESQSVSNNAKLVKEEDGRWRLRWLYENTPKPDVRDRSNRHSGVADLYMIFPDGAELRGEYFTDRSTAGTFAFNEWSPKGYGSIDLALSANDFKRTQSFVV